MTDTTIRRIACTAPTPKGITLPCPACREEECVFSVDLYRLDDTAFTCQECNEEFTFDQMRNIVNRWSFFLTRVSQMAEALSGDLATVNDCGEPIEAA